MIRELKFRAWCEGTKKMYYCDWQDIAYEVGAEFPNSSNTTAVYENTEYSEEGNGNNPLMQFTGLHDKNDKEIYEGDIVKAAITGVVKFGHYDNGLDYELREVGYGYYIENSEGNIFSLDIDVTCEVIDNIYENSELLEEKK